MRPRDQTREARLQYAGKSTQKYPHHGIRKLALNPGTYTQSHTPIVVQRGGEGGVVVDGLPFPTVFDVLQYFVKILHSLECIDLLYKVRYSLWVVALPEACDVTSNGRHLGCHLGFYHELEIR